MNRHSLMHLGFDIHTRSKNTEHEYIMCVCVSTLKLRYTYYGTMFVRMHALSIQILTFQVTAADSTKAVIKHTLTSNMDILSRLEVTISLLKKLQVT